MTDPIASIETLINQGRYLEARTAAESALLNSTSIRLKQLLALSISKSGVPQAAVALLEPEYVLNPDDPETAGIMGSIYKEIFRSHKETRFALLSRDTYLKNFAATHNYYTGINAATMSAIAGQMAKGREIAAQIIPLVEQSSGFWETVTLAEALLLNREREKAGAAYLRARNAAGTDWGKISSVYKQLWLLNHYLPVPKEILKLFNPPGVVSFIGHMIDHPSRKKQRFPPGIERQVGDAISVAIQTLNARIGFCSLACGSDILFAEAMEAAGGEVNIWIPFAKEDFVEASVNFAGGNWKERFEHLLARFPVTYLTLEPYAGYDDLFSFQNRVIFGSAVIRSSMNHTEPTLLTVLSESDSQLKEGGTRDTVNLWPYPARRVNINPDLFHSPGAVSPVTTMAQPSRPIPTIDRPVLYGVAADIPGMTMQESEKLWSDILQNVDLPLLAPATFEMHGTIIVTFKSILAAMDFAKGLLRELKIHFLGDRLRMSLYANPAPLKVSTDGKRKVLDDTPRDRIIDLHSQVPAGAVFAFARFSSALCLDIEHYSVNYAGVVSVNWFPRPLEIYRVNIADTPGRPVGT